MRELGDGRGDEHEVGAGDRVGERRRRLDGLALVRDAQDLGIGIPAAHGRAGPPGGERSGRADQARPDDGDISKTAHDYPRISSATRNARSSDWRAFKRGSQSVSYRVSSCSSSTASEPPRHSVTSSPVISR